MGVLRRTARSAALALRVRSVASPLLVHVRCTWSVALSFPTRIATWCRLEIGLARQRLLAATSAIRFNAAGPAAALLSAASLPAHHRLGEALFGEELVECNQRRGHLDISFRRTVPALQAAPCLCQGVGQSLILLIVSGLLSPLFAVARRQIRETKVSVQR